MEGMKLHCTNCFGSLTYSIEEKDQNYIITADWWTATALYVRISNLVQYTTYTNVQYVFGLSPFLSAAKYDLS